MPASGTDRNRLVNGRAGGAEPAPSSSIGTEGKAEEARRE